MLKLKGERLHHQKTKNHPSIKGSADKSIHRLNGPTDEKLLNKMIKQIKGTHSLADKMRGGKGGKAKKQQN